MNEPDPLLDLLLKSARAEAEPEPEPPPGFTTRIAARWAARAEPVSLWAKFSLASLPFGVAAAVVCLWLDAHDPQSPPDERGLAQEIVQSQIEP